MSTLRSEEEGTALPINAKCKGGKAKLPIPREEKKKDSISNFTGWRAQKTTTGSSENNNAAINYLKGKSMCCDLNEGEILYESLQGNCPQRGSQRKKEGTTEQRRNYKKEEEKGPAIISVSSLGNFRKDKRSLIE